jgi:hypothetical protein
MSTELTNEFEARGYVILRSLIEPATARFLKDYAVHFAVTGKTRPDHQVPATPAGYGAPMMERLLFNLVPVVEEASGRSLFPTYSYFRVYKPGDALARHKDRPACEISLSLCLGYQAAAPWPLFIEGPSGISPAELQEGDGLLYKGIECPHWRDPFEGEMAAQVFLHYVDQQGPHAEWRFDKRQL